MRIIFMGSGAFGVATLQWLSGSGQELVEVVTQPAQRAGRGRQLQPTPIAQTAAQLNIPCRESADVNTPESVEHLRGLKPEVILVIAFGQKIGNEIINITNCRTINLHGSLLPKYRGAAPINWAIINGDKETGLTVIEINEVWDGGAILGQLRTVIKPQETAGQLYDRLAELGPELVGQVLGKLEKGTLVPKVQDQSKATRAPKLCKADGAIRWSDPAQKICHQIHGMWPWPGAYCYVHKPGKKKRDRLIIARAQVLLEDHTCLTSQWPEIPGTLGEDMGIWCGTGRIRLEQVKKEGGKLMSFHDLVNGWHLQKGDVFSDG